MADKGLFLKIDGVLGDSADRPGTFELISCNWAGAPKPVKDLPGQLLGSLVCMMADDPESRRLRFIAQNTLGRGFPSTSVESWSGGGTMRTLATLYQVLITHTSNSVPPGSDRVVIAFTLDGLLKSPPAILPAHPAPVDLIHEARSGRSRPASG